MRSFVRVGAAVALASAGAVVAIGSGTAGAAPVSEEFEFTGEAQDFVVPAGVCSVDIDAYGAQGGAYTDSETAVGGLGGRATATITVTPGETLVVTVGGVGGDSNTEDIDEAAEPANAPPGDVSAAEVGLGGFNGGGDGGDAGDDPGAGGGGGSDIRSGGTALEHRVMVAGGGGGAGGADDFDGSQGGDGGGEVGDDGAPSGSEPPTPGGGGGTQTAGGAADTDFDPNATDGDLGQGGQGGIGINDNDGGGGAGGGYYGGGGGAGDDNASDDAGGGGGGSGFGPAGVAFETGVEEGDGFVSITYDPAVQACPVSPVVVEPTFTG